MYAFEYDRAKSLSNERKHGISFHEAEQLWADPQAIDLEAKGSTEPRYMLIAKISGKHWSAIYTYRGSNVRIISVRRSRNNEVRVYEGE